MHDTLQQIARQKDIGALDNCYIFQKENGRLSEEYTCKDSLLSRLKFNNSDFFGDCRNTNVFFFFSCRDFKTFKTNAKDVFKLFNQDIPCNFYYDQEKDIVAVRLRPDHFWRSHFCLTDMFTIFIRAVAEDFSGKTKQSLIDFISRFSFNGYRYDSVLLTKVILNFEEFLELIKSEDINNYLRGANGMKSAASYIEMQSNVNFTDEFGGRIFPTLATPQSLINFIQ